MRNTRFAADCNEGELFTYAETLYDRIIAGDSRISFTLSFRDAGRPP
jgi:hypothetical protein